MKRGKWEYRGSLGGELLLHVLLFFTATEWKGVQLSIAERKTILFYLGDRTYYFLLFFMLEDIWKLFLKHFDNRAFKSTWQFLAIFWNEIMTILTPTTSEGVSGDGHVFHFGGPCNVNILIYVYIYLYIHVSCFCFALPYYWVFYGLPHYFTTVLRATSASVYTVPLRMCGASMFAF